MPRDTDFRQKYIAREVRRRRITVIGYVAVSVLAIVAFAVVGYALMK